MPSSARSTAALTDAEWVEQMRSGQIAHTTMPSWTPAEQLAARHRSSYTRTIQLNPLDIDLKFLDNNKPGRKTVDPKKVAKAKEIVLCAQLWAALPNSTYKRDFDFSSRAKYLGYWQQSPNFLANKSWDKHRETLSSFIANGNASLEVETVTCTGRSKFFAVLPKQDPIDVRTRLSPEAIRAFLLTQQ